MLAFDEYNFFDDSCLKQPFSALAKLKYLKELNLKCFFITETGAETLAKVLTSLQLLEKLVLKLRPEEGFGVCVMNNCLVR